MSNQDNGGLAFPVVGTHEAVIETGMTLRDYFAAQVISALVVAPNRQEMTAGQDASYAYRVADAMLAARGQQ
jgi:hypothetical protein